MLEVKNLTAGYGDREVLHNISFTLNERRTAIIGPNGCGKTTLLKCIAELIEYRGDIILDGVTLKNLSRRALAEQTAVMSQFSEGFFPYSVFDTVMLGRYAHIKGIFGGKPGKADRYAVEEAIAIAELNDIRDRAVNTLSGGQLQRVFWAKVLAQNPKLILLDEPTNHLDLKHQLELIDHVKTWSETAERHVVGVFHDINLALRFSENVIFMQDGNISRIGKFKDIADKDFLKELFGIDVQKYMNEISIFWNGK
jgi:iron complex transport system ATP-binding protein